MKTPNFNNVERTLRLENLEARQLFDAASILESGVVAPVVEEAAAQQESVQPIAFDLEEGAGANAASEINVTFQATSVENVYVMDWDDMDGAASYNVKISRDGGETWITYRKPTESACELRGMYVDNTYMFRIYAVNEAGKLDKDTVVETSFTPSVAPVPRDEIGFAPNGRAREYTMEWTEVEGAAQYRVLISKDGGETWLQYRPNSEATSTTVKGLYAGKTYMFQVVAVDAAGQRLASGARYTVMSPVDVTGNLKEYEAGDTLVAELIAAAGTNANVKWYAITPNGNVEIEGTEGQLSTKTTDNAYPIKVVATGTGDAEGSTGSYTFNPAPKAMEVVVSDPYDTVERTVGITWDAIDGVAKYVVQKQTASGGWAKAAVLDSATTSYTIRMFNVDETKTYRVVAQDASGVAIDTAEIEYTAVKAVMSNDKAAQTEYVGNTYANGETVTVETAAGATFEWSYSADNGATWTTIANTSASYTIDETSPLYDNAYTLKAVATDAEGRESVVYAYAHTVAVQPQNLAKSVAEDGKLVMTFKYSGTEEDFGFQYKLNGTWVTMTSVTVEKNEDGSFTATYPNSAGTMQDNEIRVRAIGENGVSFWNTDFAYETPSIVVTTAADTLDPNDGVVSLREAVLYYDYLASKGQLAEGAAITFDPKVFTEGTEITLVRSDAKVSYPGVYENANAGGTIYVGFKNTDTITIDGAGAKVVVDGGDLAWKFFNNAFTLTSAGTFNVKNMTLQNAWREIDVLASNTTVNIDNCVISAHDAAIYTYNGGNFTVTNTTFDNVGNSVLSYVGSAIYTNGSGNVTVENTKFNNVRTAAIYAHNTTSLTVNANVITKTKTGVDAYQSGDVTVSNTAFLDVTNGVSVENSTNAKIINDTFYGASSKMSKGIVVSGTPFTVANTIVWNYDEDVNLTATRTNRGTVANSLAQDGVSVSGASYVTGSFTTAWRTAECPLDKNGNIVISKQGVKTAPASGGVFNTLNGGDDKYVIGNVDANGNTRVVGSHVDVGACELHYLSGAVLEEAFADLFIDGAFND